MYKKTYKCPTMRTINLEYEDIIAQSMNLYNVEVDDEPADKDNNGVDMHSIWGTQW